MRLHVSIALAALAVLPLVVTPSTSASGAFTVVATDFQFLPETLVVPRGTTVTWIQGTAAFLPHTVTSAGLFDFEPGDVGTGNVIASYTFDQPTGSVILYSCKPHAILGMRGAIVVV